MVLPLRLRKDLIWGMPDSRIRAPRILLCNRDSFDISRSFGRFCFLLLAPFIYLCNHKVIIMLIHQKAFTLIELLIVVAIIAILAAIAVPNFLEAQVRAKVSRAKNDMRAIATGLEAYQIEWNKYPADVTAYDRNNDGSPRYGIEPYIRVRAPNPILCVLSTPIAYMSSIPRDTFKRKWVSFWAPSNEDTPYAYSSEPRRLFWLQIQSAVAPAGKPRGKVMGQWVLYSYGPDRYPSGGENLILGLEYAITRDPIDMSRSDNDRWGAGDPNIYDATNGTVSMGDIARVGP